MTFDDDWVLVVVLTRAKTLHKHRRMLWTPSRTMEIKAQGSCALHEEHSRASSVESSQSPSMTLHHRLNAAIRALSIENFDCILELQTVPENTSSFTVMVPSNWSAAAPSRPARHRMHAEADAEDQRSIRHLWPVAGHGCMRFPHYTQNAERELLPQRHGTSQATQRSRVSGSRPQGLASWRRARSRCNSCLPMTSLFAAVEIVSSVNSNDRDRPNRSSRRPQRRKYVPSAEITKEHG